MKKSYVIHISSHLSPSWANHLPVVKISNLPDGTTQMTGGFRDQAALHGLLAQIGDLGLELISLRQLDIHEGEAEDSVQHD